MKKTIELRVQKEQHYERATFLGIILGYANLIYQN